MRLESTQDSLVCSLHPMAKSSNIHESWKPVQNGWHRHNVDTTNSWLQAFQERIANRKKDRNHKITTRLVSENVLIVWSKDNHKGIAKKFGKSVSSSAHAQIRGMLSYKSPTSGTTFIEAASKDSTKTCNECGSPSGPTGLAGLSVRQWVCRDCGAQHDRDVNAAINTLILGAGCAHEVAYV